MATSLVKTSSILQGFPKSRSLLAGNAYYNPGATFLIDSVTVGSGGASSVSFSSIPSTYQHLQIRILGRTDRASSAFDGVLYRLNNDTTTSNYTMHYVGGDGSTTFAGAENGTWAGAMVLRIPGSTAASNSFGTIITDILDINSTSKYKTLRSLGGQDLNGSGEIYFGSNAWLSTSAVTSLVVVPRTGTNFVQYSKFSLYGYMGS